MNMCNHGLLRNYILVFNLFCVLVFQIVAWQTFGLEVTTHQAHSVQAQNCQSMPSEWHVSASLILSVNWGQCYVH